MATTVEDVVAASATAFEVPYADLVGRSETEPLRTIRRATMWLALCATGATRAEVGKALGREMRWINRGTRRIDEILHRLEEDPDVATRFERKLIMTLHELRDSFRGAE
jgi:chromosomal replication initiation ATPase DnaA